MTKKSTPYCHNLDIGPLPCVLRSRALVCAFLPVKCMRYTWMMIVMKTETQSSQIVLFQTEAPHAPWRKIAFRAPTGLERGYVTRTFILLNNISPLDKFFRMNLEKKTHTRNESMCRRVVYSSRPHINFTCAESRRSYE